MARRHRRRWLILLTCLFALVVIGWVTFRPTDATETDGLVVSGRTWASLTGSRHTAQVRGTLIRGPSGCVGLAGRDRSLLMFEHGTRWADDAHTRVRLTNGTEVRFGDEVVGGGGYYTGIERAAVGKCATSTEVISLWF